VCEITLNREYSLLENLYTLIFVMLPFPFVVLTRPFFLSSLGIWSLLGAFCYFVLYKRVSIEIEKKLIVFISYVVVITILMSVVYSTRSIGLVAKAQIGFALNMLNFYWLSSKILNYELAVRIYIFLSLLFSVFLIVQVGAGYLGHPFSLIQPGLMVYEPYDLTTDVIIGEQLQSGRFSSIFLEPAHFAQYTMVGMVLLLFVGKNDSYRFLKAGIITAAIIASSSSLGLVISFAMWGYYFLMQSENIGKAIINLMIFGFMVLVFGLAALSDEVLLSTLMGKINSVADGGVVENTSMYMRMVCGWQAYSDFPFLTQVFGCGNGNVGDYINISGHGLSRYIDTINFVGYMGCMPMLFCEMGLVGCYLFFSFLYSKLHGKVDVVVGAFLMLLFLMAIAVDGSVISFTYTIPMVFMFMWADEKKN